MTVLFGVGCITISAIFRSRYDIMEYKYSLKDEIDFVAWIASNGLMESDGRIRNEREIQIYGVPKKPRNCIQRIDFLRSYAEQFKNRSLPAEWRESDRTYVLNYISRIAIPSIEQMRQVTLGDLV